MSPQHMVEHLDDTFRLSLGENQDFEFSTPENILEKVHDSLYNYRSLPKNADAPQLLEKDIEKLEHKSLSEAKQKLLKSYDEFVAYFQENPETTTKNVVFGHLNKFEWDLFQTKHVNHHFEQFGLL